jgi:hypothetical protein
MTFTAMAGVAITIAVCVGVALWVGFAKKNRP